MTSAAPATTGPPEEERRLAVLEQEMADRLMARPASEVYDLDGDR
ncbi:MAG: DUF3280 domain-containing protein [Actinomycetota bacterium]|nr:DUF3280 domain-containing protein [Actinomycetota bacterium]